MIVRPETKTYECKSIECHRGCLFIYVGSDAPEPKTCPRSNEFNKAIWKEIDGITINRKYI